MNEPLFAKFEEKPRWKGAPKQCLKANLPAFPTEAEAYAFNKKYGCHMLYMWQCEFCGWYHYESVAPSPGGESSGASRFHKHYT